MANTKKAKPSHKPTAKLTAKPATVKGSISLAGSLPIELTAGDPIPVAGEVSGAVQLQRQKWEYYSYKHPNITPGTVLTDVEAIKVITIINNLGVADWELVSGSLDTRMVFKRPFIH